jgi:hypothetical protein
MAQGKAITSARFKMNVLSWSDGSRTSWTWRGLRSRRSKGRLFAEHISIILIISVLLL